jgi:hypothetical protein
MAFLLETVKYYLGKDGEPRLPRDAPSAQRCYRAMGAPRSGTHQPGPAVTGRCPAATAAEDPSKRQEDFEARLAKNEGKRDKQWVPRAPQRPPRLALRPCQLPPTAQAHLHQRGRLQARHDVRRQQGPPHGALARARASERAHCAAAARPGVCLLRRFALPPAPALWARGRGRQEARALSAADPRARCAAPPQPPQYEHWAQILGHQPNKRRNQQ